MPPDPIELVRAQRRGCVAGGSPLYATVLDSVADDLARSGPCAAALGPYLHEPPGAAALLRFLASVHEIVLAGDAPQLARHYPSMGGTPGQEVGADFVTVVEQHLDRVRDRAALAIQTNEVGRSAVLLGGFLTLAGAGLPLRVLEVGASAGLNLNFDRYRYEAAGRSFGPQDSPVRFVEPWVGGLPHLDARVEVAERRGCDLAPLDPASAGARRRLRAYLWPDQPERRARLDAALEVAAAEPVAVDRLGAVDWLTDQLAQPAVGQLTVVVHSVVAQYLPPSERASLKTLIVEAGERASLDAPVAWLRMEPSTATRAELSLTLWPRPTPVRSHVLATSGFHGPPVHWR